MTFTTVASSANVLGPVYALSETTGVVVPGNVDGV
jgi:hypothetical protein